MSSASRDGDGAGRFSLSRRLENSLLPNFPGSPLLVMVQYKVDWARSTRYGLALNPPKMVLLRIVLGARLRLPLSNYPVPPLIIPLNS